MVKKCKKVLLWNVFVRVFYLEHVVLDGYLDGDGVLDLVSVHVVRMELLGPVVNKKNKKN